MTEGTGSRWVILELNSRAEGEDPDLVCQSIRSTVKGAEVFVPAAVTQVGDDRVVHYLMDGYAFIRDNRKVSAILRLEATKYVNTVLTEPGTHGRSRQLSTVPNRDIEKMQKQIAVEVDQGICIGDKVLIISGPYRNIEAKVIEEIPQLDQVQVFVSLRSKKTIVTLPRSFLEIIERTPLSPVLSRLTALGAWTRAARPIFKWDPSGFQAIQERFSEYEQLTMWQRQGLHMYACVSFAHGGLDTQLSRLRDRFVAFEQLDSWVERSRPLFTIVASYQDRDKTDETLIRLHSKLMEVAWFEGVFRRIKKLRREIDALAHRAAKRRKNGNKMAIQNVLIDGHNLAFRCLYAPGMKDLAAPDGRLTGMILGFLRSLGSLRKRYPDARIYVAWDGSSRRRKQMYDKYKANRPSASASTTDDNGWNPVKFLKDILPLIGVRLALNADEEADDIIATLARGDLSEQHNLIFSNDKDLLQLVTPTTVQLVPGAGTRKESLFNEAAVEKLFGVEPGKVVDVRAFYGDKSDNIEGVPRVPKKVLRSLVKVHGSVEGVYKSRLTGVTRGQYDRLRLAEPQVRLNLTLMSLLDIPVSVTEPNVDSDAAIERLKELAINPDTIGPFLGRKAEKT